MRCDVTINELACLADGGLESGREIEVKQHAAECETCRQRLEVLEGTDEILAGLPATLPPKRQVQTVLLGVALANLPDRQRQAIDLRVTKGLSDRKIAAALGVPVDVAQSLIARARSNLARALDPLDNPNVRYASEADEGVRDRLGVPVSV